MGHLRLIEIGDVLIVFKMWWTKNFFCLQLSLNYTAMINSLSEFCKMTYLFYKSFNWVTVFFSRLTTIRKISNDWLKPSRILGREKLWAYFPRIQNCPELFSTAGARTSANTSSRPRTSATPSPTSWPFAKRAKSIPWKKLVKYEI